MSEPDPEFNDEAFHELMREYASFESSEMWTELRAQRVEDAKDMRRRIAELLKEMYRNTNFDEAFSGGEAYLVEHGQSSPTDWGERVGRRLYVQLNYLIQLHKLDLLIRGQDAPDYEQLEGDALHGFLECRQEHIIIRRPEPTILPPDEPPHEGPKGPGL